MLKLIIGFTLGNITGMSFLSILTMVHFHDKLKKTVKYCPWVRYKYGKKGWKRYLSNPFTIGTFINNMSNSEYRKNDIPAETEENRWL